jgi:hypothetical protein
MRKVVGRASAVAHGGVLVADDDRIRDLLHLNEGPHHLRAGLIEGDPEHDEAALAEFLGQLLEVGHLHAAGTAPGGPEIEQDDLAAEVAEAHRLPFEIGKGEVRGLVGIGAGECACAAGLSRRGLLPTRAGHSGDQQ